MLALQAWRAASLRNEEIFQRMTSRQHFEESFEKAEMTEEEMSVEWELICKKLVRGRRLRFSHIMQYACCCVRFVVWWRNMVLS